MKTKSNLERTADILVIVLTVAAVILLVAALGPFSDTKPVYQGF